MHITRVFRMFHHHQPVCGIAYGTSVLCRKVRFFAWMVSRNCLPTWHWHWRRNCQSDPSCHLWNKHNETLSQLFFNYPLLRWFRHAIFPPHWISGMTSYEQTFSCYTYNSLQQILCYFVGVFRKNVIIWFFNNQWFELVDNFFILLLIYSRLVLSIKLSVLCRL